MGEFVYHKAISREEVRLFYERCILHLKLSRGSMDERQIFNLQLSFSPRWNYSVPKGAVFRKAFYHPHTDFIHLLFEVPYPYNEWEERTFGCLTETVVVNSRFLLECVVCSHGETFDIWNVVEL